MAAAAVPIALHLLAKREPKRVVFPALQFITQRHQSNRSRMQIRRWWLLALRVLALLGLALVLARPNIDRALSTTWISVALLAAFGVTLLVLASIAWTRHGHRTTALGLVGGAMAALLAAMIWGGYNRCGRGSAGDQPIVAARARVGD